MLKGGIRQKKQIFDDNAYNPELSFHKGSHIKRPRPLAGSGSFFFPSWTGPGTVSPKRSAKAFLAELVKTVSPDWFAVSCNHSQSLAHPPFSHNGSSTLKILP